MRIPIVPVPSFNGPATQLECIDTVVNLGVGLNTEYRLLNEKGELVSARLRASLTDSQYADWTGEDQYVCQCVAINVGLTPLVEPPVVEQA